MSSEAISLYKSLMKAARTFQAYNYRNYALRRIKDAFKADKNLTDKNRILERLQFGRQNLEVIKRQAIIGNMYSTDKLIIETGKKT